ncbi:hypothetical protein DPMN_150302 [Dreissena polymorpha]|uniref:Uncharacterized protein n=1 Tax=Dreissena polymorpha TaxID=45954 RepID=A0A9D4J673_DREPO|nr:hypothetical protein DPMN_150302 [Dreissena polymorpha]
MDRSHPSRACIKYKAISHMQPSKGKGREGGLETPGAQTWMQMLADGPNMGAAGETRPEPLYEKQEGLKGPKSLTREN